MKSRIDNKRPKYFQGTMQNNSGKKNQLEEGIYHFQHLNGAYRSVHSDRERKHHAFQQDQRYHKKAHKTIILSGKQDKQLQL